MGKFSGYITAVLLLFSVSSIAQQDEYMVDTVQVLSPPPEVRRYVFLDTIPGQPADIRKISPSKIEELKNDEQYWYANLEPEKKEETKTSQKSNKRDESLFEKKWFRNLLWILVLCSFIAVVIWYLASSNISLFRKSSKKIIEEESSEAITDDIFSIHFEKEIRKAVEAKNFRLAIRLWYLQTLKELSERNIIDYRQEKTDNAYVNSLFGSRYYSHFFRLTRNFEYTWYGQFNLSAEMYEMMRADFLNFKNSLA